VDSQGRTQRARRRVALSLWSVTAIAVWAAAWWTYVGVLWINTCFLGTAHGGRARSLGWAGFIGFLLLLAAAFLAFRWRRRLLLVFAAFFTAYVAVLLALWAVSPAIWGSVRCTYD
jgi:hypothetical protein